MVDAGLNDFLSNHPEYHALGVIGRGGMGTVYLAEQLRLQRRVAVKVLEGPLAEDPRARERFLRETRAVASIDHPGVLPIYDAGEAANALFTVMRFVDGPDLRLYLRENGPQPEDVVRRVGIQVGEALGAAHARGIVHRDVKPANVLLASSDLRTAHTYLCDFGLAKRLESGPSLTKMDEIVGTVDYIAPEQIEGGTVDARTDIYSLACVLYEMLLGQPPFQGHSHVAVLWSHLRDSPPALRASLPDVPEWLDALLQSSMAKSPGERPSNAAEFVAALRSKDSVRAPASVPRATNASAETIFGEQLPPVDSESTPPGEPEAEQEPGPDPPAKATDEKADGAKEANVDPPASGRRRMSRKTKVLAGSGIAAVLVVAVVLGLVLGSNGGGPHSMSAGKSKMGSKHVMHAMSIVNTPRGNASLTKTDKAILAHADPQVTVQCSHFSDLGDWDGAVAGATCTPPHGANSVSYLQFTTQQQMDEHFSGLVIDAPTSVPAGNCADQFNATQNAVIRYAPAVSGNMICYLYSDGTPEMVWTNDKFLVLAWATGQTKGNDGAQSLLKWWELQGGLCDPKCQDE
jgi:serine/threonine protein kinase